MLNKKNAYALCLLIFNSAHADWVTCHTKEYSDGINLIGEGRSRRAFNNEINLTETITKNKKTGQVSYGNGSDEDYSSRLHSFYNNIKFKVTKQAAGNIYRYSYEHTFNGKLTHKDSGLVNIPKGETALIELDDIFFSTFAINDIRESRECYIENE